MLLRLAQNLEAKQSSTQPPVQQKLLAHILVPPSYITPNQPTLPYS